MNLACLYLEYNQNKYKDAFPVLKRYLKNLDIVYYRIDNRNEGNQINCINNIYEVQGDNTDWEFSGWTHALKLIPEKYDVYVLVNDAMEAAGTCFLRDYGTEEIFQRSISEKKVIGRLNTIKPFRLYNSYISSWISTNAMIFPFEILSKLNNLATIQGGAINEFIPKEQGEYFLKTAPISNQFKAQYINFITKDYHSKFRPETNWNYYINKTKAILNEFLLTEKIRQSGFDIAWYGDERYY